MSQHIERLSAQAASISHMAKQRHLESMSEDDFRDRLVRPLFLRLKFQDGRETCGVNEAGKDAYFTRVDGLGATEIHAVQTKKGKLTLASGKNDNVDRAITQLRTAFNTKITVLRTKQKQRPLKVYLIASGSVSQAAEQHILEQLDNPQLVILDGEGLIPLIDEHYPEFWQEISADVIPYFRALKERLTDGRDTDGDAAERNALRPVATDELFANINVFKIKVTKHRRSGQFETDTEIKHIPVTDLPGQQRERLILLLGEGGAGKSTAIRRLAYITASKPFTTPKDVVVPIMLRAVDVAESATSTLLDDAAAYVFGPETGLKPPFSTRELDDGRVIFMVDGLDELHSGTARVLVAKKIRDFHALYPKCQCIVTSRPHAFLEDETLTRGFTQYRISPLSLRQAQKIVLSRAKQQNLQQVDAKEILRRLQDVHGIELNPLFVTIFVATSDKNRGEVPANITELFKKYTELMLGRWDEDKGLSQLIQAPTKDHILTQIAFEMHEKRVTEMPLSAFRARVESELQSIGMENIVPEMFDEIVYRSGLFWIADGAIGFRHHVLQEFFAGRGIQREDFVSIALGDEWWKMPLVFYFGQNPGDVESLDKLAHALKTKTGGSAFRGAVTLGLAVQACYLSKVDDKARLYKSVLRNLVLSRCGNGDFEELFGKFPISILIVSYLYAREAVGIRTLPRFLGSLQDDLAQIASCGDREKDDATFWLIAGLIEANAWDEASALLKTFKPKEQMYLLALLCGALMAREFRTESSGEKNVLDKMVKKLSTMLGPDARRKIQDRYQSEILEIQQGKIVGLSPASASYDGPPTGVIDTSAGD